MLTMGNLLCGAVAATIALQGGDLTLCLALIVVAVIFDFFDGFVARLLGQSSPLGVELDSLADCITSGFAPAAMLYALYADASQAWLPMAERTGYLLFLYTACAALRLAKFNIDDTQRDGFSGLPSPAAALFCASLAMLAQRGDVILSRELILVSALGMGAMMICNMRMFALKFHGFGWRGNGVRYSFLAVSLVLILAARCYAIPAIIALYIVVSLVATLVSGAKTAPKA